MIFTLSTVPLLELLSVGGVFPGHFEVYVARDLQLAK